jgi:hypothetical protein
MLVGQALLFPHTLFLKNLPTSTFTKMLFFSECVFSLSLPLTRSKSSVHVPLGTFPLLYSLFSFSLIRLVDVFFKKIAQ